MIEYLTNSFIYLNVPLRVAPFFSLFFSGRPSVIDWQGDQAQSTKCLFCRVKHTRCSAG